MVVVVVVVVMVMAVVVVVMVVAVAAASVVGWWLRVRGAWSVRWGEEAREEAGAVVGCTSSISSFQET